MEILLGSIWQFAGQFDFIGQTAFWTLTVTYGLWIFFLATMGLYRAYNEGKLNKGVMWLSAPILVIAFVLDLLVNVFVCTPVLLEIPKEITVSSRLTRHIYAGEKISAFDTKDWPWRSKVSYKVAKYLLDPFDPAGVHRFTKF